MGPPNHFDHLLLSGDHNCSIERYGIFGKMKNFIMIALMEGKYLIDSWEITS